jgi:hypothetical protein
MVFSNPACSFGLSATSQQYFSLRTNQPPATSRNQPAVPFSQGADALKDAALLHHSQDQDQGEPQAGTVLLQ